MKNEAPAKKAPTRIRRVLMTLVALIAVAFAAPSFAHKGASGVVKQRMDVMKEMKVQLKQILNMVEGKSVYDVKGIKAVLDYIGGHAGAKMTRLFPKGTAHKPSEADPLIWKNWSDFEKLARQLNTSIDEFRTGLVKQESDEQRTESLQKSYLSLRRTCKNCHDRFRE